MAAAVIKTANKQYKLTDKQRDRVKKYYAQVLCDASKCEHTVFGIEDVYKRQSNDWLYPLDDLIADKSITDDALLDLDGLMQSSVDAQRYEDKLYGLSLIHILETGAEHRKTARQSWMRLP